MVGVLPEIWTHYTDTTSDPKKDARVQYDEIAAGKKLVLLPSGITPRARFDLLDKFGVGAENLVFTNAPGDTVTLRDGTIKQPAFPDKVLRAKELVTEFLNNVVRPSGATTEGLVDLIKNQQVEALSTSELAFFMRAHKIIGADNAKSTEGATTPHDRGTRKVAMNKDFHTLSAIVHELFHVLEANNVASLGPGLYEGLTEFMTTSATGLDIRRDMTGEGYTYERHISSVKKALAQLGTVTEKHIYNAYFGGELEPLRLSFEAKFDNLFVTK